MARVTEAAKSEWTSELKLALRFYDQHVKPTAKYARAFRSNAALWENVHNWPEGYHQISANLVFANTQSNLARVLARHPQIMVTPSTRATRMSQRMGGGTGFDRFVGAALVSQMVNWRWREFDFSRQVLRAALDAETRGFGEVRHGFKAEDETSLVRHGKSLETLHHKHIRGGWPFAVHWPVNRVLWDQLARDPDERRWVAFLDWWRPEDLKQKFNLRREIGPTHTLGMDLYEDDTAKSQSDFGGSAESIFGRVGLWEIWDRRRHEVVHMVDHSEDIVRIDDWPLDFEGLPDTMLWTQEASDRMWPVPDVSLYWELQQLLNTQLSMLAVYIKRGVPLIGINTSGMEPSEANKLADAEIMEVLTFRASGSIGDTMAMLNLQPPIQNLILGIQTTMELIRQVGGNSKLSQGTRENVESGSEAQAIVMGSEIRNDARHRAVERFSGEIVRKDWQVFQQTVTQTQVLDIAGHAHAPLYIKLTPEQIKNEYDFSIRVGSTEPASERKERERALGFLAAMQSDPEIRRNLNPRFLTQQLAIAFGYDELEALAGQDASLTQGMSDAFGKALGLESGGGMNGSGVSAALDSMKSNAARSPLQ